MADMKKLLHTFDEADEILNDKIERTNLSTIVASATASVENKKTVLIRGTGRNIEVLKVGGKTVQNGTPTPTNPVEVKGVGDKSKNLCDPNKVDTNGCFVYENGTFVNTVADGRTSTMPSVFRYNASGLVGSSISYNYANNTYSVNVVKESTFDGIIFGHSGSTKDIRLKVDMSSCTNGKTYTLSFKMSGNPSVVKSFKISDIQLEEGSTPTPYEAYYKGYKIPILTDGNTQDIYLDAPLFDGDVADLVSGKAEKKYGMVNLEDIDWTLQGNYWIGNTPTGFKKAASTNVPFSGYCSTLEIVGMDPLRDSMFAIAVASTGTVLYVSNKSKTDKPVGILVYELTNSASETFDGAAIPTTVAETELTLNTEVTPASIEATTFGDYYTKSEVDKKFGVVYGKITSSTGTIDENSTYCVKSGNVVSFRVKVTGCTIDRNWGAVANLPFKPIKLTNVFNIEGSISSFWAQTDGTVSRYATISNSTLDISGIYITND